MSERCRLRLRKGVRPDQLLRGGASRSEQGGREFCVGRDGRIGRWIDAHLDADLVRAGVKVRSVSPSSRLRYTVVTASELWSRKLLTSSIDAPASRRSFAAE